ncbi:MAG: hypothetical protein ABI662_05980 [Dermatophilaceae bacterium]
MTFYAARDLATKAAGAARHSKKNAEDPGLRHLADAVALLAEAVEELARSNGRQVIMQGRLPRV